MTTSSTTSPTPSPISIPDVAAASSAGEAVWAALSAVSMAACAVHGLRRNNGSIAYGIWWGAMGALFPVISPAIALAQGFAQPTQPLQPPPYLQGFVRTPA